MKRRHYLSIALIALALVAVMVGIDDPQGTVKPARTERVIEERQSDEADNRAGYSAPQRPDDPPRGPGEE